MNSCKEIVDEEGLVFEASNLGYEYENILLEPETIKLRGALNIHIEQFRLRYKVEPDGIIMNNKTWEVINAGEEYHTPAYRTIPVYRSDDIKHYSNFELVSSLNPSKW